MIFFSRRKILIIFNWGQVWSTHKKNCFSDIVYIKRKKKKTIIAIRLYLISRREIVALFIYYWIINQGSVLVVFYDENELDKTSTCHMHTLLTLNNKYQKRFNTKFVHIASSCSSFEDHCGLLSRVQAGDNRVYLRQPIIFSLIFI